MVTNGSGTATRTITIPASVSPDQVMTLLAQSLGYKWSIVVRSPLLVCWGRPAAANLPHLLLRGGQLLVDGGTSASTSSVLGIERALHRLSVTGVDRP